jgi:hypothetical protein
VRPRPQRGRLGERQRTGTQDEIGHANTIIAVDGRDGERRGKR